VDRRVPAAFARCLPARGRDNEGFRLSNRSPRSRPSLRAKGVREGHEDDVRVDDPRKRMDRGARWQPATGRQQAAAVARSQGPIRPRRGEKNPRREIPAGKEPGRGAGARSSRERQKRELWDSAGCRRSLLRRHSFRGGRSYRAASHSDQPASRHIRGRGSSWY
jgi:hypothetical protein